MKIQLDKYIDYLKSHWNASMVYVKCFARWLVISLAIGIAGGAAGALFHFFIAVATDLRKQNDWLIFLLPISGIIIIFIYRITKMENINGTNFVIDSIRKDGKVPAQMAPAILTGTVLTHLCGGSAGREGAALQLGGSIGSLGGRIFRLDEKDMHVAVFCGMSAVFTALFGTPVTAVIFVMEVISVGTIYYNALLPCICSSLTGYIISLLCGFEPEHYNVSGIPDVSVVPLLQSVLIGIMCAALSIVFCVTMGRTKKLFEHLIKNEYLRIIAGGAVIVLLTFLLGTRDYNGTGSDVIERAIEEGRADPAAFLLKIVFTAVTLGSGFKGGEIVPTFYIGAVFGCVFGPLIGMNPSFAAAVGLTAMFCAATNTPVASIILGIEMFGAQSLVYIAAACSVSYMLSGYYSLYSSQKIVYGKLKSVFENRSTKE